MEDWLASEQSIDTLSITPVTSSQDLLLGASTLSAECSDEGLSLEDPISAPQSAV